MWNKLLIWVGFRKKPKTAIEKLRDILSSQMTEKLDLIWGPELDFKPVSISQEDKDLLDKQISDYDKDDYKYYGEEQDEGS
jgi:hypothetical protein